MNKESNDCLTYFNFLLNGVHRFRRPMPDKRTNYDLAVQQLFEYMIDKIGSDINIWETRTGLVDGTIFWNWGSFADENHVY